MVLGNDHDCWLSLPRQILCLIDPGVHRLWQSLELVQCHLGLSKGQIL